MDNTTTSMIFRIETDLKKAFERVAGDLDLTASQMLRAFVRDTVQAHTSKNAQKDLFKPVERPEQPKGTPATRKPKKAAKNAAHSLLAQIKRGM